MQIIFCVNVVILSFPILAAVYSKMIFDVRWMSKDFEEEEEEEEEAEQRGGDDNGNQVNEGENELPIINVLDHGGALEGQNDNN